MPMPRLVVDTDVVSFLFKQDTRAEAYLPHLAGQLLIVSFQTLAELDRWVLERNWGAARIASLERYLNRFLVYPYDRALCHEWARVTHRARRAGRPIQAADAWIAATATLHQAALLTHNPDDFAGVPDLNVISEPSR